MAAAVAAATGAEGSENTLPDVTVKAYLESVRDQLAQRIIEHAQAQVQALMGEFEMEKKSLLEDAEAARRGNNVKRAKPALLSKKKITVRFLNCGEQMLLGYLARKE